MVIKSTVKAIPLHQLSPDAFTLVSGASESALPIDRLYKRIAWLRRAVDVRSDAIGNMPFCIRAEDEQDVQTELGATEDGYEIMPDFSWAEFLNYLEGDLILYGAFYFIPVSGARTKRLFGFKRLHPSTMTAVLDGAGNVTAFKRAINNKHEVHPAETVGYIWTPNRNGETGYGEPIAKTALVAAQMLYNMDVFGSMFFERGAINPTVVTIQGFDRLQEAEQQRVRSWFDRTMTGLRNAFSVLPLATETSIQQLGSGIGDLTVPDLTDAKRQDISTALGIPQSLLFSNASNYATARQDDLHFYDKTILPQARFISEKLNQQLFSKFKLPYDFRFEPERLDVFQQMQLERANVVKSLVGQETMAVGILTRDEARAYLGYSADAVIAPEPEPEPTHTEEEDMGMDVQNEKYFDDLTTWQRYANKRIKEGRAVKAMQFNSDLPKPVHAMIVNALKDCDDVAEVKRIFEDVRAYLCHSS